MLLLASLVDLTAKYGNQRLNVMYVNLDDVLEFSPFQNMGLNKRPAVAKLAVELVLLWQFGGTVRHGGDSKVRVPCVRHGCRVRRLDRQLTCHLSPVRLRRNAVHQELCAAL